MKLTKKQKKILAFAIVGLILIGTGISIILIFKPAFVELFKFFQRIIIALNGNETFYIDVEGHTLGSTSMFTKATTIDLGEGEAILFNGSTFNYLHFSVSVTPGGSNVEAINVTIFIKAKSGTNYLDISSKSWTFMSLGTTYTHTYDTTDTDEDNLASFSAGSVIDFVLIVNAEAKGVYTGQKYTISNYEIKFGAGTIKKESESSSVTVSPSYSVASWVDVIIGIGIGLIVIGISYLVLLFYRSFYRSEKSTKSTKTKKSKKKSRKKKEKSKNKSK